MQNEYEPENMPKEQSENVTIREVYGLVAQVRTDVANSLSRLENKFDTLESGRLSNVEQKVSSMEGKMTMIPVLISAAISIFGLIVNLIMNGVGK
jgi:hypothetical protein